MEKTKSVVKIKWYYSMDNLRQLASYLVNNDGLDSVEAVLYFFEKPWKWGPEWIAYQIEQRKSMRV